MIADREGAALPSWIKKGFWAVVVAEWTIVGVLAGVVLIPIWHGPTRRAVIDMLCLNPETTRYAAGYSDAAWAAIQPGDGQARVLTSLGEPLDRWSPPGDQWWSYSTQKTATDNYRERKLRFDRGGRVLEKHEECYID